MSEIPELEIQHVHAQPLAVPLIHPFVVATAEMHTTPNVRFDVNAVRPADRATFFGMGEAAPFPPITRESQETILAASIGPLPIRLNTRNDLDSWLAQCDPSPVFQSGLVTAILDVWSRAANLPFWQFALLLIGEPGPPTGSTPAQPFAIETDITLPIAEPQHMATMALQHVRKGFRHLKLKAGKNLSDDLARLAAVANALRGRDVALGVDANTGFSEAEAIQYLHAAKALGVTLWNLEEPTRKYATAAQRAIRKKAGGVPIVADESCQNLTDLNHLMQAQAADAVNLKFVKHAGPLKTLELGLAARRAGMRLMVGCMVDTRLGISAMLHVVRALGEVEFVDLDTAFLLQDDPFVGGYRAEGNRLFLEPGVGLTVSERRSKAPSPGRCSP